MNDIPVAGPALSSPFTDPVSLATDSVGNVYIADSNGSSVLKVDTSGALSFFAGTGSAGTPVAGTATSSPLNYPDAVAVDAFDNVYIADYLANRLLKVDTLGQLSIIAGNGVNSAVVEGTATSSPLRRPTAVTTDSTGNVYVFADRDRRVVKIDLSGNLTIVAGSGSTFTPVDGQAALSTGIDGCYGLAFDADGNLFVSDYNDAVIFKIDAGTQLVTTVAGTGAWGTPPTPGPATSSSMEGNAQIAFDADGALLIADQYNHDVERVDLATGLLSVFVGTDSGGTPTEGLASASSLRYPAGLAIDQAGNAYIASNGSTNRIVKIAGVPSAPGRPTGLVTATTGNRSVTLNFTAPVSDGGSAITGYDYTIDGGTTWLPLTTSGTTAVVATVTGLRNGTLYTLAVRAKNATTPGTGAASTSTTGTPHAPPPSDDPTPTPAPTPTPTPTTGAVPGPPLSLSALARWDSLLLSFGVPTSDGGSPITSYEYSLDGSTWLPLPVTGSGPLAAVISGLTNGIAYPVQVRAVNVIGAGPPASTEGTPNADVPSGPRDLSARSGDSRVALTFTVPEDDGGADITGYRVSVNRGAWRDLDTSGTAALSAVVDGLSNGSEYAFRVRAVNAVGVGATSETARTTPVTVFADPVSPARRAAELPVPKHPEDYQGKRRHTQAWLRSHNGTLAVPIPLLRERHLSPRQAATLSGDGLFDFDSADLTAEGRQQVKVLVTSLKGEDAIRCEGYTDYGASVSHENTLSLSRAKAICGALVAAGVDVKTRSAGYGPRRPVIIGGPRSGRAANRRVVVYVL